MCAHELFLQAWSKGLWGEGGGARKLGEKKGRETQDLLLKEEIRGRGEGERGGRGEGGVGGVGSAREFSGRYVSDR